MNDMKVWVDADACPRVIKEILYRAASKREIHITLVANQPLRHPVSNFIDSIVVGAGFDVADDEIVKLMNAGDLVITADTALAAAAIEKNGFALNPRGQFYTTDNIQERLAIRNMLDELRGCGEDVGGPDPFSAGDKQEFANQLDRFLTNHR